MDDNDPEQLILKSEALRYYEMALEQNSGAHLLPLNFHKGTWRCVINPFVDHALHAPPPRAPLTEMEDALDAIGILKAELDPNA